MYKNIITEGSSEVQKLGYGEGVAGEGATRPPGSPFPCLYSRISNENEHETDLQATDGAVLGQKAKLSTNCKKSAHILASSVALLADKYGLEHLGFLTLTFAENILCPKEAQKRLNSLLTGVITKRYRTYLGVLERQKSGRIHYHFILVLDIDIRTGFDFEKVANQDYKSASQGLRNEWRFWRFASKAYGFGRTELLPIKSTVEAISRYVGKYISKHMDSRLEIDRGVRLVRYGRDARAGTTRFQFHTPGASEWRCKVNLFAMIMSDFYGVNFSKLSDLSAYLGIRWAYQHRDFILGLPSFEYRQVQALRRSQIISK